ncbi:MAG: glycosyltransferase family 2 protein [Pseudomonadales bacterium]|nr:glycosyltransferase family 2 protein [Pseudomonadales bacterium]
MQQQSEIDVHTLSVVVPMYNEEDNVRPMTEAIQNALSNYPHPWELIYVDDGSSDRTLMRLKEISDTYGEHVRIVELQRNFGQTAAMQAGIDTARGCVLVTLDGDLQNDPNDIPRLVKRLLDEDLDLLVGWRKNRKDNLWVRKIPSRIANYIIGVFSGVRMHDYGCTLKVYRTSVLRNIRLYGEMHRFIPAWVASYTSPARIKEEVVNHNARQFGESKYGLSRVYRVLLDLFSVYFFMGFKAKPAHFFGRIGLAFGSLGGLLLVYLAFVKFALGEDIGSRPSLIIGVLFVVVAIQFFTTGIMGELMARTYYESTGTMPYVIRHEDKVDLAEDEPGWYRIASDKAQQVTDGPQKKGTDNL